MTNVDLLKSKAKELLTTEHELIDSIKLELTNDPGYGWGDDECLGKYYPIRKKIRLYNSFHKFPERPELAVNEILPTYMHELVHAMQHRECGTLGYLLMLGLFRWKLEKDAREIEESFYL